MTVAIVCIVIAAVMPIVCAGIAKGGAFHDRPGGYDNRAPRAWLARQTGYRERANAAQTNAWEALTVFAPAVLAAQWLHAPQGRVDVLAAVFIAARLGYVACYIADRAALRSALWTLGFGVSIVLFFSAAW